MNADKPHGMLYVLHIYIIASEASEIFEKCTRNIQKMFTIWSVSLDSAEIFFFLGGGNWKLRGGGTFPPKGA